MNRDFHLQVCKPDDAAFTSMLPRIYPTDVPGTGFQKSEANHLQDCWVLFEKGEAIGRIALYNNKEIFYQDCPTLQLGLFECINDLQAAAALFSAAAEKAEKAGIRWLLGPLNGTTWNRYRFITEKGTEPLFSGEPEHPDYYPELWQKAGFVPVGEYLSNLAPMDISSKQQTLFWSQNNLRLETVFPENLEAVLNDVYPLCSAAFADAPFYSPITVQQFIEKLSAVAPLLNAGLTKVVYDAAGEAVTFALCFPDPLSKDRTILKTAARKKDSPVSGIMAALYSEVEAQSIAQGRPKFIHAFMHEDNSSATRSRYFGGSVIRRYTLFGLPV